MKNPNIKEILNDPLKLNQFILKHKKFILNIMWEVCPNVINTYEKDDYIQEGFIQFHKAMEIYDESKHPNFFKFAEIIIKRWFIKINIRSQNKLAQSRNNILSLDKKIEDEGSVEWLDLLGSDEDVLAKVLHKIDNAELSDKYNKLLSNLKPEHKYILIKLFKNKSQADIARELGCSRENIRQKVNIIKKKAQELLSA